MKSGNNSFFEFIASNEVIPAAPKAFKGSVVVPLTKSSVSPYFIVPVFNTESFHTCIGETLQKTEESRSVNFSKMKRKCKKTEFLDDTSGYNLGRWNKEEKIRFIEGLEKYKKDWKKIQSYVATRSIVQIRSHAQKYFSRLEREEAKKQLLKMGSEIVEGSKYRSVTNPIVLPIKKVKLKRYSPGITQIELKSSKNAQDVKEDLFSDIDKQVQKQPNAEENKEIDWELPQTLGNINNLIEPIDINSEIKEDVDNQPFFDFV